MRRFWMQMILVALLPCYGLVAYAEEAPSVPQQRSVHLTERGEEHQADRQKAFRERRLEYIIKEAGLTKEEGTWFGKELLAYDQVRIDAWHKRRTIREALTSHSPLSEEEQVRYLEEWITIDANVHAAQMSFTMKVKERLAPMKALKALVAQRFYNGHVARQARGK